MKIKLFLFLLLLSAPAFAADDTSHWYGFILDFFNWIKDVIANFVSTFLDGLLATLHRALAYFIEWAVVVKLKLWLSGAEFAYGVAQEIADDLNLSGYLMEAVSSLPSDLKYVLNLWGVPNCLNIIMNAYLTKFVMNFMGW
jgi:hypothetical protein